LLRGLLAGLALLLPIVVQARTIRLRPPDGTRHVARLAWYSPADTVLASGWFALGDDPSLEGAGQALLRNLGLLAQPEGEAAPADTEAVLREVLEEAQARRVAQAILDAADEEPADLFGLRPIEEIQWVRCFDPAPGETLRYVVHGVYTAEEIASLKAAAVRLARAYLEGSRIPAVDVSSLPPSRSLVIEVSRDPLPSGPGLEFGDAPDPDPRDCDRGVYPPEICAFRYPSRLASDGARHMDPNVAWLGWDASTEAESRQIDRDDDDGLRDGIVSVHNERWDGLLYLNVLIDQAGDGDWDDPEDWVQRNVALEIPKGESRTERVETAVGRWFRITLTGRPLVDYDGRGDFDIGETEDYFIRPREGEASESLLVPYLPPDTVIVPREPGRPVPEDPRELPRRRIVTGPHAWPCRYHGGPCADCMREVCRRCYGEECLPIRAEALKKQKETVSLVKQLNELAAEFKAAKERDPEEASAIRSQWHTLREKLRKLDAEIAALGEQVEKCAKRCQQQAVAECRQACSGYEPGERFPATLPDRFCREETAGWTNPALDDPDKKRKAIAALTKGKPREGALRFLLWKMQAATDPRSLEARRTGVRRSAFSLDSGTRTVRLPATPWFEPRERVGEDCCRWVEVRRALVIRYRLVLEGWRYDFDFLLTVLDLNALREHQRNVLEQLYWILPGEGTTTTLGRVWGSLVKAVWSLGYGDYGSAASHLATGVGNLLGGAAETVTGAVGNIYSAGTALGKMVAHYADEIRGLMNRMKEYESVEPATIQYMGNYVYAVRVKGTRMVPVKLCFIPEDAYYEIEGEKTVGTFPCGMGTAQVARAVRQGVTRACEGAAPQPPEEGDVSLIDVIPGYGNNPFDPEDPLAGERPREGGDEGGEHPVEPCSAGPVERDEEYLGVAFYYNEQTGECIALPGLAEEPPGFPGYLLFIYPPYEDTPAHLLVGNSYWSLVSASAGVVTPGQFGSVEEIPTDTPVELVLRCDMCAGSPLYQCTLIVGATTAEIRDFRRME
jgi:hypothetical protein